MKLFFRYIAIVTAVVAATTGCAMDELGLDPITEEKTDAVTVIGRITRFDDKDVTTRGVKDQDEAKLTSMAMAIFKVNAAGDGLDGGCAYYQYADDQAELLFTIERGSNYDYDTRYAMYVFCNMPDMGSFGTGTSLEDMMAAFYEVENIDIPTNGFPMMGSLGDTFSTNFDKDGKVFILSPTDTEGKLTTPKVDGVTQTLLTIPMKAMFAKVNFTIEVRPDQTIDGNYSPQFILDKYTVNNVPSTIDFDNSSNSEAEVLTDSFSLPISGNTVASGANKISFSFYLPERYLEPKTQSSAYNYPFKKDGKIRDEDRIYMQRYKPQLVGTKKATNVKITGRFRDHQNHHWNVDYTIYLGEDNYGDFNIKRNCEYNNFVTIRGIQTSSDMSDEQDAISIDHRVNIERTQPGIISLRREVLLDSHFEVRPLRVRKSEIGDVEGITHVKVEVVNPTATNWMRLERSFGDGTLEGSPTNESGKCIYINENANDAAYGKRRYFTYNLVDGKTQGSYDYSLVNSTEVILPLSDDTECCWIYVDECTEIGDDIRSGIVKVSYGNYDGTNFTPANNPTYPDVNYVINQRKLFNVTGPSGNVYSIEYSEEYLYNFDADDEYCQTEYEGMEWGLEGIQLSYDHPALFFTSYLGLDFISDIVNWLKGTTPAFYDFYITSHDADYVDEEQAELHDYKGYDFCNEIITTINGGQKDNNGNAYDTDSNNNIDILQLDEQPRSAIEYCYNKNKRNAEGHVAWQDTDGVKHNENLVWYLPAIDEIEDIVMSKYGNGLNTYARFLEFQEQDYWSCQPAYLKNYARYDMWIIPYYGDFFTDDIGDAQFDINSDSDRANVGSARSTSVSYNNGYSSTLSGTNGYYYYYNANNKTPYYTGTYNGKTMNTVSREPGNQPRNEKNRVRCVRKQ